jgi:hypothetical protein
MNLDEIINEYYSKNQKYLEEVAYNVLKNINKCELADTLVTNSYFYIAENKEKLAEKIEKGQIEAIAVQFMTKQVKWNKTDFKKTFTGFYEKGQEFIENIHDQDYDSNKELDQRLEEEYDEQKKLAHIKAQRAKLDPPQQILYDLCIDGPYKSSRKLAKYLGLNRTTTYVMIRDLKLFLKKDYE